jgi:hypothetical protein
MKFQIEKDNDFARNEARNPARNQAYDVSAAENTLRLIASLPSPAGLEERMKASLQLAAKNGKVLRWPAITSGSLAGWMHGGAMRAAAAAAIVFVVAGGGWGVYSSVQQAAAPKVIVMPQSIHATRGFSSAGAMRTPQTLNGPVITHSIVKQNEDENAANATKPVPKVKRKKPVKAAPAPAMVVVK